MSHHTESVVTLLVPLDTRDYAHLAFQNCQYSICILYVKLDMFFVGLDATELLSGKSHTLVVTGSQDYGIFVSDITKQNSAVVEYYNKKVNSVR